MANRTTGHTRSPAENPRIVGYVMRGGDLLYTTSWDAQNGILPSDIQYRPTNIRGWEGPSAWGYDGCDGRFLRVEANGGWYFTARPATDPPPIMPVPVPTEPIQPASNRINVLVRRTGDYRGWEISVRNNGEPLELPDISIIKSLLPTAQRRLIRGRQRRYSNNLALLISALNRGMNPQVLHDALKAWVMTHVSESRTVESETILEDEQRYLLQVAPATLAVGGRLFRLVPTGEMDITTPLKHLRQRAKAVAQIEVTEMRNRAQIDARAITGEAEDRAASIRQEVERIRQGLGVQPPEWVRDNSIPLKLIDRTWYAGLFIPAYVESIRLRVERWQSTLWWDAIHPHNADYYISYPMLMWLRLSPRGAYTLDDVSVDRWKTVHTANRVCMTLQNMPRHIDSLESFNRLREGISRGMRIVNLNSPLTSAINTMYPLFVEQLPPIVIKWLNRQITIDPDAGVTPERYRELAPTVTWDRIETDAQEMAQTFEVRHEPTSINPEIMAHIAAAQTRTGR